MTPAKTRVRKSVKLLPNEFSAFKKWVNSQETKVDACDRLGLSRPSLDRIMLSGSGSEKTINKIVSTLNQPA